MPSHLPNNEQQRYRDALKALRSTRILGASIGGAVVIASLIIFRLVPFPHKSIAFGIGVGGVLVSISSEVLARSYAHSMVRAEQGKDR